MIWRDIRLLLLAGLVLFSLYYILSPSLFGKPGVVVNQIGSDARCANVGINSVITQVDLYAIKSIEDYNLATSAVTGGQFYSYANTATTWEIDANLESTKFATQEGVDGGDKPALYEVGNDPGLDI